jgi:hypothetical protein
MADQNPYAGLFISEGKAPASAKATAPVPSGEQKAKDAEAVPILQTELAKAQKALEDARKEPTPSDPAKAAELQAKIARHDADVNSLIRELATKGAKPAEAPASTASKPYSNYFTTGDGDVDAEGKPKDKGLGLGLEHAAAVAGGLGGALYGKAPDLSNTGTSARMMERMYGLPPGALAEMYQAKNPGAPLTDAQAARQVAERMMPTPAAPAAPAPPPAPPAEPLSAMEKWAASQVGEESVLPKAVIGQATSNYASDPTGAPQIIQENAAKTRLARRLVPPSSMQVSPGGVPYAMSQQEQQALIRSQIQAQRQAAIEAGLNEPVGARPTAAAPGAPEAPQSPLEQMRAKLAANIQKAGGMSNIAQRGANLGLNVFGGVMGGYQGTKGLMNMAEQGVNPSNALETTSGLGALAATRYPNVGFPVAGAATMGQAGLSMQEQGPTAQNVAQGISGAGMVAMPKAPLVGMAMQAPALTLAMKQWLAEHPDWWKRINAFQTPASAPQ